MNWSLRRCATHAPTGPRWLSCGVLALAVTVLTAGCDMWAHSTEVQPGTVKADAALSSAVPAAVKADGKLVIATDPSYAPNEFLDSHGRLVGMDVELGQAIAAKLDLRADFARSLFDGIIPGVKSGKYELGMSSMTIRPDRLKDVQMVSYFKAGTSIGAPSTTTHKVSRDTLCGLRVAVQKGTVQADELTRRSQVCKDGGKAAIRILQYELETQASQAVSNGAADALIADSPVLDYLAAQSDGAVQPVGASYDNAPYGIVLAKVGGGFSQVIQAALKSLILDGTYEQILRRWNVDSGRMPSLRIELFGAAA